MCEPPPPRFRFQPARGSPDSDGERYLGRCSGYGGGGLPRDGETFRFRFSHHPSSRNICRLDRSSVVLIQSIGLSGGCGMGRPLRKWGWRHLDPERDGFFTGCVECHRDGWLRVPWPVIGGGQVGHAVGN
jgi:hypothetical protein